MRFLLVAFLGFETLACEVVWMRMLTLLFSNATHALAAILAVFFLGLAGGGLLASRWRLLRTRADVQAWILLGLGLAILSSAHPYGWVPVPGAGTMDLWQSSDHPAYLRGCLLQAALVVFPSAWLLGMGFCLAMQESARAGALYAGHTAGGLLGCLLATFVIVPGIGKFQDDLALLGALGLGAGTLALFRNGGGGVAGRAVGASVAWVLALGAFASLPNDASVGLRGFLQGVHTRIRWSDGRIQQLRHADLFEVVDYQEGSASTAAVLKDRRTEDLHLIVDGFFVAGTGPEYIFERLEAHLPALLCPRPDRALVVGFGTGSTAGSLALHPFRRLDIVEIAPEVIEAAPHFASVNRSVLLPRPGGPEVRVHVDDARGFLAAPGERYDLISCDPPIPYLSGGSALFTREFYEACRSRLEPDGLCSQWIPHTLYEEDARLLVRTFHAAFPHATLWFVRNTVLLIGSMAPLRFDPVLLEERLARREAVRQELAQWHLDRMEALLSMFWCGPSGIARYTGPGALLSGDRPVLEYYRGRGEIRPSMAQVWNQLAPCREQVGDFLEGGGVAEAGRRREAWLRRYGDLQTLAFEWNRARMEPYVDRVVALGRLSLEAKDLLPPGVSAWAFFEGRERPGTSP